MSDDSSGHYDRRSVLKMTGAGLAAATGVSGTASAADGPSKPENLAVTRTTDHAADLEWDEPSDGAAYYTLDVHWQGWHQETVVVDGDATSYEYDVLGSDGYYKFELTPHDLYHNKGETAEVIASTEPVDRYVHREFDLDDDENILGGDWHAENFDNVYQEKYAVVALDYDGSEGELETFVADPDGPGALQIEDHQNKALKFQFEKSEKGGEEADARFTWNGGNSDSAPLEKYCSGTIRSDRKSVLTVPLVGSSDDGSISWNVQTPDHLRLEFGKPNDNDSEVFINQIWISNYPE